MEWGDDDHGGLDDLFVPRDPRTGDPVPDWTPERSAPRRGWWRRRRSRRAAG